MRHRERGLPQQCQYFIGQSAAGLRPGHVWHRSAPRQTPLSAELNSRSEPLAKAAVARPSDVTAPSPRKVCGLLLSCGCFTPCWTCMN
jgi:hypothetical protein